jgi:hypothetical protein
VKTCSLIGFVLPCFAPRKNPGLDPMLAADSSGAVT